MGIYQSKYYYNRKNITTIPYTYIIKNITTGLKYYGVRFCYGANPDLFFKDYFTSSKIIHILLEKYGPHDFEYEIRKTFNNPQKAVEHEKRVLRQLKLNKRSDFANKDINQDPTQKAKHGTTISITNGEIVLRWPNNKEIPINWQRGNIYTKNNTITKNRIWCHNPIDLSAKMITNLTDLPENYILGRPITHSNSKTLKSKQQFHITNGKENSLCVGPIPLGWYKGRTISESAQKQNSLANKKFTGFYLINNGAISHKHNPCFPIPTGWVKGRLPNIKPRVYKSRNVTVS